MLDDYFIIGTSLWLTFQLDLYASRCNSIIELLAAEQLQVLWSFLRQIYLEYI